MSSTGINNRAVTDAVAGGFVNFVELPATSGLATTEYYCSPPTTENVESLCKVFKCVPFSCPRWVSFTTEAVPRQLTSYVYSFDDILGFGSGTYLKPYRGRV